MALRIFKHMRAGLETVRGTNVAPTRGIPFSEGTHNPEVETIYPEELRGSLFAHYVADAGTETNSLEISGAVGFNLLPWWLNLHVKAVAAGTGASADKTWTFLPSSSTDDLKTATIQMGYADGIGATRPAAELAYCIGDELTLTWDKSPGATGVNFSSRLVSPEAAIDVSAFTGVGTFTAEAGGLAKANATAVTIDTATLGATVDNDILSFEWTLNDGTVNLYTLNNTAAAQDTLRPNPWMWSARIRRYRRTNTEEAAYRAKTMRKIRVRTLGPVLGGSFYKIDLELYGKYTGFAKSETDGLGIEELTLSPVYDTGAATDFQVVVVNDQATLT